MHPFARQIRNHFGATPPIGYCLRADHPARWLRIHSLPGAKRYAEEEDEHAEVRRRAWATASEMLVTGSSVWLVIPWYEEERDALPAALSEASSTLGRIEPFENVGHFTHTLLEEPCVAYAAKTTWPHVGFDALITQIAADTLRATWFCETSGVAFAPYDGG